VNRTKVSVLALFGGYWVIVAVLLVAAPAVYDRLLDQVVPLSGNPQPAETGTLLALTVLLTVLSIGVIRGWRWTFWLILIVFLFGIVRVLTSVLQLAGIMPHQDPAWYVVLQAVVGLLQFVIALGMLAGYRKAGIWGAF
jgi:hypothetical protein